MKRVVVTGMGLITPLGNERQEVFSGLRSLKTGISYIKEWDRYHGLRVKLAGAISDFASPPHYDRKKTRTMARSGLLAARATELALEEARVLNDPWLKSGEVGIAYGSATGSPAALEYFVPLLFEQQMKGISATSYMQMMPHSCAANISLFWGVSGRVIPTCSACTSGSQAIGYSYEAIKHGYQTAMIAGGAEELSVTIAAVFDSMFAASLKNETPITSPAPFDRNRDGLVIAEAACTLFLEELEHAKTRGSRILAEVCGYATNADATHVTNPSVERMAQAMQGALNDAAIPADAVGYINAHATGTETGDLAESKATNEVFGPQIPVSSLKSFFGHTMGACGSLESCLAVEMMNCGWFCPTLNLKEVDPKCAELNYIMGTGLNAETEYVMNNNFAFGGTNTSLIFKRWG